MQFRWLMLGLLFLNSCATVTRGVHEKLRVTSEPSGANVELSSGERGVAPITFVKRRKDNFDVTVSMAGYIPQTVKVRSNFSPTGGGASAANILVPGIVVGVGVDAVSGATLSLYPNPVNVRLVPAPKPPKPAARSTTKKSRASITNIKRSPSTPPAPPQQQAPPPQQQPTSTTIPEEPKAPELIVTPSASPSP